MQEAGLNLRQARVRACASTVITMSTYQRGQPQEPGHPMTDLVTFLPNDPVVQPMEHQHSYCVKLSVSVHPPLDTWSINVINTKKVEGTFRT